MLFRTFAVYIKLELTMHCSLAPAVVLACACSAGSAYASQDFTPVSSAAAIITAVGPLRAEITRKIEMSKTLSRVGEGFSLPALSDQERLYSLESGHITSAGTIVGFNSKYGVVVVLEPSLKNGRAEWRCKVLPTSAAPKACR